MNPPLNVPQSNQSKRTRTKWSKSVAQLTYPKRAQCKSNERARSESTFQRLFSYSAQVTQSVEYSRRVARRTCSTHTHRRYIVRLQFGNSESRISLQFEKKINSKFLKAQQRVHFCQLISRAALDKVALPSSARRWIFASQFEEVLTKCWASKLKTAH